MGLTYAYLGGIEKRRDDDGFLHVKGLATDETLDLDEQICDQKWATRELGKWFETGGNVRQMHQPIAAGKALEMGPKGSGYYIEAKIVDADTLLKLDNDVLTGFSVGIKGARVVKDAAAPGGRIVGGSIVEVSLVDRPANPSCRIDVVKALGLTDPTLNAEAILTEPPGVDEEINSHDTRLCTACGGTGYKTNVEGSLEETPCEVCGGSGKQPDENAPEGIELTGQSLPESLENNVLLGAEAEETKEFALTDEFGWLPEEKTAWSDLEKALYPDLAKKDYSDDERASMASEGTAMSGGGFPIKTVQDLKNAIQAIGRAKDRAATIAHIKRRAKALGQEALIPDSWKAVRADLLALAGALAKAPTADEWKHSPEDVQCVVDTIVALIGEEFAELSEGEDEIGDIYQLLHSLECFLSWAQDEAAQGEIPPPITNEEDSMSLITLGVRADTIKAATAADAPPEAIAALREETIEALGLTEIISKSAEVGAVRDELELVKAELAEAKEMVAPARAVRTGTSEQTGKSAQAMAHEVEAARLRNLADQMTDQSMRRNYLDAAALNESLAKAG